MAKGKFCAKIGVYVSNGQDGSVFIKLFKDAEAAEKEARDSTGEEEGVHPRFEGDVKEFDLVFDEDGNLLRGN